jgi:hypothetical protein
MTIPITISVSEPEQDPATGSWQCKVLLTGILWYCHRMTTPEDARQVAIEHIELNGWDDPEKWAVAALHAGWEVIHKETKAKITYPRGEAIYKKE